MTANYLDYKWKEGIPYGIQKVSESAETSYRILSDPYRKWISIEQYQGNKFVKMIYDSILFDFRMLKTLNQAAWRKEQDASRHLIRNQDDRAILIEEYSFQKGKCTACKTCSIHGILISQHKIHYKSLGDLFNGVVLYDANGHVVMEKRYAIDDSSNEFGELLSENWNPA